MNRLAVTLLFGAGALAAADEAPLKADAVLDRFIEVTGGKEAHQKVRTLIASGTVEFVGKGIKGTVNEYKISSNKSYVAMTIDGVGLIETGATDDVIWEKSAITGPRLKQGEEKADSLRASAFDPHLDWRKLYEKAEMAGVEKVNDVDCYKVVLTPKEGKPETQFFSKKTGLLLKIASAHATSMGEILAEEYFSDYRESAGLIVPFQRTNKLAGQEIQVHIESVKYNADIPASRFEPPDDVKALIKKTQGDKHEPK